MSILTTILIVATIVFVIYAYWTQYSAQPNDKSKVMRMLGAIAAAGAALGALVMSLFQSGATP